MNVETIMSKHPITVARTTSLDRAIEFLDTYEVRHLPVLEDDALVGMISDRDLLDATGWLNASQRRVLDAPEGSVGHFMSSPVTTVSTADGIDDALECIRSEGIGCLPVLQGTSLVGVVTEVDVLRCYADACRTGCIGPAGDALLAHVLTPDPSTIGPDDSGSDAQRLMSEARIRHLPVVEDGRLVGILSDRDVRLARGRGRLELCTIGEIMSARPRTLSPSRRLSSAALLMSAERISALPITEEDALVGIVTLTDVSAHCAQSLEQLG